MVANGGGGDRGKIAGRRQMVWMGQPVTVLKVRTRPSPLSAAYWFIKSANAASLPAICSAIATVASLPDEITMPRSSSATVTAFPGSIHIRRGALKSRVLRPRIAAYRDDIVELQAPQRDLLRQNVGGH